MTHETEQAYGRERLRAGVHRRVVVLISADAEWDVIRDPLLRRWPGMASWTTPYGEAFEGEVSYASGVSPTVWVHGGWGKIAAAASAQYAISRWRPRLVVNLGTCGGFEGMVERGTVILVTRTQVYDIVEQMGDQSAALTHYTTELDLSWLQQPYPMDVQQGLLLSGDRDGVPEDIPYLRDDLGGSVVDWESASIAYVAQRNGARCLILRGVTDLVGPRGGEAYDGTVTFFRQQARRVMTRLLDAFPAWLDRVDWSGD